MKKIENKTIEVKAQRISVLKEAFKDYHTVSDDELSSWLAKGIDAYYSTHSFEEFAALCKDVFNIDVTEADFTLYKDTVRLYEACMKARIK